MKVTTYYNNDDFEFTYEGKDYRIKLAAVAEEVHIPGRTHLSNGDPGYPPEDEFELQSVDAVWYLVDEEGEETEIQPTKEMTEALDEWLDDHSDVFEARWGLYD